MITNLNLSDCHRVSGVAHSGETKICFPETLVKAAEIEFPPRSRGIHKNCACDSGTEHRDVEQDTSLVVCGMLPR